MATIAQVVDQMRQTGMLPATKKLADALAGNQTPLPANVNMGSIVALLAKLNAPFEPLSLRVFRDTALYIALAERQQQPSRQ